MSNPLDEYLSYREGGSEKVANPIEPVGAQMMHGAREALSPHRLGRLGAEAAVLGGGAALLGGAVGKIYRAITKKRDFDKMLQLNPDLAEHQTQDPHMFNAHYDSLRAMNPTFAADPVVAGTYMRQMSSNPMTAGKVIVESLGGVPRGSGGMEMVLSGEKSPAMKLKY